MDLALSREVNRQGQRNRAISEDENTLRRQKYLPKQLAIIMREDYTGKWYIKYCLISLTLPVDLCLYMGALIAWRVVCSRASPGEL